MASLRYVILWHDDVKDPHFDLMFETLPGSALATWRSAVWPIEHPVSLTRLNDHRREYLDYEGELSEHRGRVARVAEGTCLIEVGADAVWTIQFLTGVVSRRLILRRDSQANWIASPD